MILERQKELRKLLDLICPYMVSDTQDRHQLLQMVRIKELGNEALDTIAEQHDGMLHATNAFTELSVDRNYRIEELNMMLRDLKADNERMRAAFRKYAVRFGGMTMAEFPHWSKCAGKYVAHTCTCGADDAAAALDATEGEK